MRKSILFCILVVGFISSCTKQTNAPAGPVYPSNTQEPYPTFVHHTFYPVTADMKAYVVFKPGTYWIYQDSVTANLDSVYVTSLDSGLAINPTDTCQWFEVRMKNSLDGKTAILSSHRNSTIVQTYSTGPGTGPHYYVDSVMRVFYYDDVTTGTIDYMYFFLPCNASMPYGGGNIWIENVSPMNLFGSAIPSRVFQIRDGKWQRRLIAKNYGLLRWVNISNQAETWNIIRCHIVQ